VSESRDSDPDMSDPGMSDPGSVIGGDFPALDPELAAWLAADPAPTMPPEVWAQLRERLAAEPPLGRETEAETVDLAGARAQRSRRRGGLALPLLAGAAGIALVGAVVLPSLRSSDPAPLADGVASLDSGGPAVAVAPEGALTEPAPGVQRTVPRAMVATGTDYTAAALPTQATSLLVSAGMQDGRSVASAMSASPNASVMPGVGLASSPEALAACLARLGLPPGVIPLVVDSATVDGREGSLIVTWDPDAEGAASPVTGEPAAVHVVAVGQACTDADAAAAMHWDVPLTP
jgi:hypothetical protein